jgi:DNA polymerase-3 subunit delta
LSGLDKFDEVKLCVFSKLTLTPYSAEYETVVTKKVSKIVTLLRDIDVKSKGVGSNSLPQHELLKEMLVGIFN